MKFWRELLQDKTYKAITVTDEWLSLSDAAEVLGVHPSTVRLWSDKGVLPVHKLRADIVAIGAVKFPFGQNQLKSPERSSPNT